MLSSWRTRFLGLVEKYQEDRKTGCCGCGGINLDVGKISRMTCNGIYLKLRQRWTNVSAEETGWPPGDMCSMVEGTLWGWTCPAQPLWKRKSQKCSFYFSLLQPDHQDSLVYYCACTMATSLRQKEKQCLYSHSFFKVFACSQFNPWLAPLHQWELTAARVMK